MTGLTENEKPAVKRRAKYDGFPIRSGMTFLEVSLRYKGAGVVVFGRFIALFWRYWLDKEI